MIQAIKSPVLAATRNRAEEKTRSFTISAAIPIVKQHGLDFAVLLVVLAFIFYAAI
jgi:hypothetical protein